MKTVPKPRLFDKRIQLVAFLPVADGFGGATTEPSGGPLKWAYIRKVSDVSRADFISRYGLTENAYLLRATIRETELDARFTGFAYGVDIFRVLVSLPNDQYRVSLDLIAVRIELPNTT